MSVLDFPTSPTNGQYYGGYVWNEANSTWDSAYAPRAATIPLAGTNAIINGGMDIWQRGTSFTGITAAVYTADRWAFGRLNAAPDGIVSRSTDVPQNFAYSIKVQRQSGTTAVNSMRLSQSLENSGKQFAGKTVTLSVYMKAGANYSGGNVNLKIVSSSAAPESVSYVSGKYFNPTSPNFSDLNTNVSLSSSWQRYVFSADIPSTANAMQVLFQWDPAGTAGVDDSVYVAGVQLEEGAAPTEFRRNAPSIQAELAACQRYFFRTSQYDLAGVMATGLQLSTTSSRIFAQYPVTMRVKPTSVEFINLEVSDLSTYNGTVSAIGIQNASTTFADLTITHLPGGAQFRFAILRATSATNSFLQLNAEL
jgi:hypothetical protein